jgi:hypothetical protein
MRDAVSIALILISFAAVSPPVGATQVPCPVVISELNKIRRTEDTPTLAMEKVAKKLETSPLWIENCMRIYGRPVPRGVYIDPDLREQLLERMEETELGSEDAAPEERGVPDPFHEPEPESAGTKKRKANEYIQHREYLPLGDPEAEN